MNARSFRWCPLGLCALLALAAGAPAQEGYFPDPNLELAVRVNLPLCEPKPITPAEMLNLVVLDWGRSGGALSVSDLTGLEYAANPCRG